MGRQPAGVAGGATASEGQRGARTSYFSQGPGGHWVTMNTPTQPALRGVPGLRCMGEVWERPWGHLPVSRHCGPAMWPGPGDASGPV